jgi:hypothetical protein
MNGASGPRGQIRHLDMLAAALEGVPIRFPPDRYLESRRACQELLRERSAEGAEPRRQDQAE